MVGDSPVHGAIGIGVLSLKRGGIATGPVSWDLGGVDGSILMWLLGACDSIGGYNECGCVVSLDFFILSVLFGILMRVVGLE